MEVNGIPLHPLAVHSAVALVPLSALLAAAHVLLPGARWAVRWAALAAAVGAVGAVLVARRSGQDLLRRSGIESPLIATHQDRAQHLLWAVLALAVLVAAAWWALPARSPLRSGRFAAAGHDSPLLQRTLTVAVLVACVVAVVLVVLTGEAGARSVWEGRVP